MGIENITPSSPPKAMQAPSQPSAPIAPKLPSKPSATRMPRPPPDLPTGAARPENRIGVRIHTIQVDLSRRRALLLSDEVFPIYCACEVSRLEPGDYFVTYNADWQRLEFRPGEVVSGQRFELIFEKASGIERISQLAWENPTLVAVQPGFPQRGETLVQIAELVDNFVYNQQYSEGLLLLGELSDTTLYDVLRVLDNINTNSLFALMSQFNSCWMQELRSTGFDGVRLLRALDSFVWTRKQLYVDSFDEYGIHEDSWKQDPDRNKRGLSNIRIVFGYSLSLPTRGSPLARAVEYYVDDIGDDDNPVAEPWTFGKWGLLYPARLSRGTTPRMWNAKKALLKQVDASLTPLVAVSIQASMDMLNLVLMGQGLLTGTLRSASGYIGTRTLGLRRPITEAIRSEPGLWAEPLHGTSNMRAVDAEYEAFACNKDAVGMKNYYLTDPKTGRPLAFDGRTSMPDNNRVLLEAKNWRQNGLQLRVMKNRISQNSDIAISVMDGMEREARVQLRTAKHHGFKLQYRMADEEAAKLLQTAFQSWGMPEIEVVYFPKPARLSL